MLPPLMLWDRRNPTKLEKLSEIIGNYRMATDRSWLAHHKSGWNKVLWFYRFGNILGSMATNIATMVRP
ncbi:MAG: hypothetical protein HC796_12660 [Synechococcaceae cyanobacterium RL_1_2]|nr:hypothetical protein [Synechococcaceae cyanobacterium RL_1_2]